VPGALPSMKTSWEDVNHCHMMRTLTGQWTYTSLFNHRESIETKRKLERTKMQWSICSHTIFTLSLLDSKGSLQILEPGTLTTSVTCSGCGGGQRIVIADKILHIALYPCWELLFIIILDDWLSESFLHIDSSLSSPYPMDKHVFRLPWWPQT